MCRLCETKFVYEFTNKRKVCKRCYINWFEKKFLYTIRKFKMIKQNDIVGYENKNDFRNVVLENLLKLLSKNSQVKIIKLQSKKKFTKTAIPETSDSASEKIIHEIIKGKAEKLKQFSPVHKKIIKPLYLFLDKEVLLYAKLKKLKFKKTKEKKDKISEFIDGLEKKHPEIKHAMIQSCLSMNE